MFINNSPLLNNGLLLFINVIFMIKATQSRANRDGDEVDNIFPTSYCVREAQVQEHGTIGWYGASTFFQRLPIRLSTLILKQDIPAAI